MMRRVGIILVATALLAGCGVPRAADPAPPPRVAEPPPRRVEAITPPGGGTVEHTRKDLLRRGVLREVTPVYFVDQHVEDRFFRFTLDHFFWGRRQGQQGGNEVIVILQFFGEKGRRDRYGRLWTHRVRLAIDGKEYSVSVVIHRDTVDGHRITYRFLRAPEPGVFENHVLVFVKTGASPKEMVSLGPKAQEGDVVFLIRREDIVIRR